MTKMRR